jgi:YcxB-like protein
MDEPISVRYEWNAEGYVDASEAHRKQARGSVGRFLFRALLVLFAVVTVGLPLAVVLTAGNWESKRAGLVVWAVVFGYIWGVFYLALWSKAIKLRGARKTFQNLPPEALFVEWTFAEDQLANRTALSSSTYLWPVFLKAVESPKGFLIYQNTNFFNWIPGHGFSSAADVRRFAELARAKIPHYVVLGECQFPAKPKPIGLDEL